MKSQITLVMSYELSIATHGSVTYLLLNWFLLAVKKVTVLLSNIRLT